LRYITIGTQLSITLYSCAGKKVIENTVSARQTRRIHLSPELAKGIYLLQCRIAGDHAERVITSDRIFLIAIEQK
jgi:hypothetical protein